MTTRSASPSRARTTTLTRRTTTSVCGLSSFPLSFSSFLPSFFPFSFPFSFPFPSPFPLPPFPQQCPPDCPPSFQHQIFPQQQQQQQQQHTLHNRTPHTTLPLTRPRQTTSSRRSGRAVRPAPPASTASGGATAPRRRARATSAKSRDTRRSRAACASRGRAPSRARSASGDRAYDPLRVPPFAAHRPPLPHGCLSHLPSVSTLFSPQRSATLVTSPKDTSLNVSTSNTATPMTPLA